MDPTVTRSQPNRAFLGCGGMGASCPGCASHKSLKMLSYQYGPTFLKSAFSTLLIDLDDRERIKPAFVCILLYFIFVASLKKNKDNSPTPWHNKHTQALKRVARKMERN